MHRYEERYINTWKGQGHVERRLELKIGNPIGRRAEMLDRDAKRVEEGMGMGDMRRRMAERERLAMAAEDAQD